MTAENNNNQPAQPAEISSFQLKASYWYVKNKLLLKKILTGSLIGASVLLYGYCIFQLVMIFFVDWNSFQQNIYNLPNDLIDYRYFREAQKPKDIQILNFQATDGREGKYDFIAAVNNPNPNFFAEITYELVAGGDVIATRQGFLLPNEKKYFGFFGQEINAAGSPILRLNKISWRRIQGYEDFSPSRLRFDIADSTFKPSTEAGIKGTLPVSLLTFKIKNNSAFSYWHVGIYMVLYAGDRIVGGNYTTLDNFLSLEERAVDIRWYEPLPVVTRVDIVPEVNILDADSFMPVQ